MSGQTGRTAGLGVLALILLASGCVSRDEYDRVEFARKNAVSTAEEREREVADARAQRDIIENERNSLRRERDANAARAETLAAENRRLADTLGKTQEYAETAIKQGFK